MAGSGTQRVTATDEALAAIGRLRDRHGPLVFVQSGGCCDGSSPICLCEGELLLGPDDVWASSPAVRSTSTERSTSAGVSRGS
jgi:uncharacterized protein (DUF779 family)